MKKSFLKSSVLMLMAPFLALGGCSNNQSSQNANAATASNSEKNVNTVATSNTEKKVGYQLEAPQNGEEIAIVNTSMGQFKMRFFPEAAPKTVENFKTHSKNGYYNGRIFHRVIENFMIQGGDPNGNGTGGESIWGKPFEDEFSDKLFNITGSVAMANSGKNTNGSQFFINQGGNESFSGWEYFQQVYDRYKDNKNVSIIDMSKITDEIKNLYNNNGGNPHLDGAFNSQNKGHTVFAQVFEGMEVIDKIARVEKNSADKPLTDVVIENIEITKFEG